MMRRITFLAIILIVLCGFAGGSLKGRLLPYISLPPRQAIVMQTPINRGAQNIVFDMEYPTVLGFDDESFENELNVNIVGQVNGAIAGAFNQAKNDPSWVFVLRVRDEVKNNQGILSLRVTNDLDNGGTGFPHTVCYNADIQKSRMLTLDDLFVSKEYRTVINGLIRKIVRNDAHYFADQFTGVSEDTAFFLAGGQLHITFGKYEIASGMTGEPDFAIPTLYIRRWIKPEYAPLFW